MHCCSVDRGPLAVAAKGHVAPVGPKTATGLEPALEGRHHPPDSSLLGEIIFNFTDSLWFLDVPVQLAIDAPQPSDNDIDLRSHSILDRGFYNGSLRLPISISLLHKTNSHLRLDSAELCSSS